MEYQTILVQEESTFAVITMNRPSHLNALNEETLLALESAILLLEKKKNLKVVVLTGSGKAFVAGADISLMKDMDTKQAQEFSRLGHRVFSHIEQSRLVFLAAINGYALGGGLELALSCDLRLASPNAVFGQPEINLGVIPGFGATQRLPRVVGKAQAKELIFTGKRLCAEEALRFGLVNQVLEAEELLPRAHSLAQEIGQKSGPILALAKQAVQGSDEMSLGTGLEKERALFALCFGTLDQKEGMDAFLQKRKPVLHDA